MLAFLLGGALAVAALLAAAAHGLYARYRPPARRALRTAWSGDGAVLLIASLLCGGDEIGLSRKLLDELAFPAVAVGLIVLVGVSALLWRAGRVQRQPASG